MTLQQQIQSTVSTAINSPCLIDILAQPGLAVVEMTVNHDTARQRVVGVPVPADILAGFTESEFVAWIGGELVGEVN